MFCPKFMVIWFVDKKFNRNYFEFIYNLLRK